MLKKWPNILKKTCGVHRKILKVCLTILNIMHKRVKFLRPSNNHCVKIVRIRSFLDPYFPAFGLKTERYGVSLRIQLECGKIRTRKTPNTDTFHAVNGFQMTGKSFPNQN